MQTIHEWLMDLGRDVHQVNLNNGWWETAQSRTLFRLNAISEITEAWEAHVKQFDADEKTGFDAFTVELADYIIRCLDRGGRANRPILYNYSAGEYETLEDAWIQLQVQYAGMYVRHSSVESFLFTVTSLTVSGQTQDAVGHIMAYAQHNKLPLLPALLAKNEYNKGRGYRHGGKLA